MYILLSLVCICSLKLASFQSPRPASCRLQYRTASDGKLGDGLETRLHQSKLVPKLHWDCKFGRNTPALIYFIRFFSVHSAHMLISQFTKWHATRQREREREKWFFYSDCVNLPSKNWVWNKWAANYVDNKKNRCSTEIKICVTNLCGFQSLLRTHL